MYMNATKEWSKMTEKKTSTQNALKVRARAKGKKPAFVRPESWRYAKFSVSWRRPRGLDNKVRRTIKGWPPMPCSGYMGPKIARGLHPSGYEEVLVHTTAQVACVKPDTQAIRIGHTVGMKKRVLIIAEARKLGITILNAKEVKATESEEKTDADAKDAENKQNKPKQKRSIFRLGAKKQ
jgi:large subunit ribosomal protein L32e